MRWMRAGTGARLMLAISGLFAVSALATTSVTIETDRVGTIQESEGRSAVVAQMVEEHARLAFDISKAALLELGDVVMESGGPRVTPAAAARMSAWVRDLPQINAFWLIDADGRVIYTSRPIAAAGHDVSDREYFNALRDGGEFLVGRMTLGRLEPGWFFTLSRRLVDKEGNFRGVLVASMRTDYFASLYNRLGLGEFDNITLYRADGAVVARRLTNWSGDVVPSAANHPLITDYALKAASGVFEGVSPIDHVLRLCAFRRVDNWPLIVLANSDKDRVLEPWRRRAASSVAYCAAVLAALAFLTWWGYRRISGEARALATATATATRNAILLNEVHHRVKNNLAIIQSLLMLEANQVAPEARQGYEHSIARVEAMGLVHHLLYQTQDFEGIDAAAYLRRLTDGLGASAPATIEIVNDVEAVAIDLDTAIPLALIVNEVVINALKHGFPDGRTGRVTVRLRHDGGWATLTVEDDGVGLPDGVEQDRLRGLGLMLVTQLTKQLGGTWTITCGDGASFTLGFPLRAGTGID